MILLTIGTYPVPFDRFVRAVDEAVGRGQIQEEIFGQIGHCTYEPQNFPFCHMLPKSQFDETVAKADKILGQAGIGTITMALERDLPALVVPRLRRYGEMVNDHQLHTARTYERLGHVLAAYETDEIVTKLPQLESFRPTPRVSQPKDVAARVGRFLKSL